MKTDRELLELAAKSADYVFSYDAEGKPCIGDIDYPLQWNPLTDDGDALRLAVKLYLWVHIGKYAVSIQGSVVEEMCLPDPYTATRRAIVRAAAAIGEAMP